MKNQISKLSGFYLLLLLGCLLIGAMSCSKDDAVDPEISKIEELSATWSVNTVSNDGLDVSHLYTGFSLRIDGLNYSTQNGGNAWPANGTYEFKNDNLDLIERSDGVEVEIVLLTANELTLSFNQPQLSGKVAGITGDFTFSLSKQ